MGRKAQEKNRKMPARRIQVSICQIQSLQHSEPMEIPNGLQFSSPAFWSWAESPTKYFLALKHSGNFQPFSEGAWKNWSPPKSHQSLQRLPAVVTTAEYSGQTCSLPQVLRE
jgi:hypothetical protein